MKLRGRIVAFSLLLAGAAGCVWAQTKIRKIQPDTTLQDALYISSPQVVKRLGLGYSGLMADIYWTRVVQYFGKKHRSNSGEYKALAPLLNITTTLDPSLIVAYEFGSVFLAQNPPEGAGDPDAAIALINKGIRNNPDNWHLYYTLGYFEYIEKKDFLAAARAFDEGSKKPGAHIWMKVMAAKMMSDAGSIQTARYMWSRIYEETRDREIKLNAARHLESLKVDEDVIRLEDLVSTYKRRTGEWPVSWRELIAAGLLKNVPLDPTGVPYVLKSSGHVQVENSQSFGFLHYGLPPHS